ncbi:hypothetical protein jhhlp_000314 [Lomentospora prolificans]|uniref:(4-O-methyl)-D-glucuronate--lignin esterase n=1 Tax=Lomentospora prolificans TaxID=41688 RepID=A0A2N3NKK5_9PEZI|nr:hypothetical protein jhhlp_000314 [Lomentospora prolificans]
MGFKHLYLLTALLRSTAVLAQENTIPAECAEVEAPDTFEPVSQLPNPFEFFDGSAVETKDEWACRRAEIRAMIEKYELGAKPPKPADFKATLSGNSINIELSDNGKSIAFSASIKLPSGSGPFPAMIALGGASIPIPNDIAVITYNNEQIAATDPGGKGLFYQLYPTEIGGLMAWGWGVSRILDALEELGPETTKIDPTKVGVTGCSRNGKGALVSGAFDDRIALTLPQEGGSGGPGCWRLAADMKSRGINVEDGPQIVTGDQWFSPVFSNYVKDIATLPHDHHQLMALVAPRGLLVIENSGIDYLGPWSSYGCSTAAQTAFEALGVKNNFGISQVAHGTSHCQLPSSQNPIVEAWIDKFLRGKDGETNVFQTDATWDFEASEWIGWTTPELS